MIDLATRRFIIRLLLLRQRSHKARVVTNRMHLIVKTYYTWPHQGTNKFFGRGPGQILARGGATMDFIICWGSKRREVISLLALSYYTGTI